MTYETLKLLSTLAVIPGAIGVLLVVILATPWWPKKWGRLTFSIIAGCAFTQLLIFTVLTLAWPAKPFLGFALVALVPTICFGSIAVFWKNATTSNGKEIANQK